MRFLQDLNIQLLILLPVLQLLPVFQLLITVPSTFIKRMRFLRDLNIQLLQLLLLIPTLNYNHCLNSILINCHLLKRFRDNPIVITSFQMDHQLITVCYLRTTIRKMNTIQLTVHRFYLFHPRF